MVGNRNSRLRQQLAKWLLVESMGALDEWEEKDRRAIGWRSGSSLSIVVGLGKVSNCDLANKTELYGTSHRKAVVRDGWPRLSLPIVPELTVVIGHFSQLGILHIATDPCLVHSEAFSGLDLGPAKLRQPPFVGPLEMLS
jgi:hypothetical protein